MPLPPPSQNITYATNYSYVTMRPPGYYGAMFSRGFYSEIWFKKVRSWVRVPKNVRHLTNPYTSYRFQAEPAGRFTMDYDARVYSQAPTPTYETRMYGDLTLSGAIETWLAAKVSVSSNDVLLTQVRNSVLKQAAGTTFNAALFVAEGHKTLELLFTNASKIARSFREIKHGRITGQSAKETLRKAMSALGLVQSKKWDPKASRSAQWLEYRYGVETLMMDVRDAAEFAASKMSDQPERHSWRSQVKGASSTTTDYTADWRFFAPSYTTQIQPGPPKRVFAAVTTAKAWLVAELETSGYRSMQQAGFANPLGLAWELIPFSFVADWALGIGQYLDLQTSLWGLKVVDAGYSLQRDGYVDVTVQLGGWNPAFILKTFSGANSRSFKSSRYQRWVWSNPSPEYTLGSGLNMKRAADAVALFNVFRK